MAKQNDAGVYKLKNGNWAYRYVLMVNGVRKEVRKAKDEFGASFKTKREAIKARQAAIDSAQNSRKPKPTVRKTVQEVYQEYCANGRSDRAYTTKRKQDSLWKLRADVGFCRFHFIFREDVSLVDDCNYRHSHPGQYLSDRIFLIACLTLCIDKIEDNVAVIKRRYSDFLHPPVYLAASEMEARRVSEDKLSPLISIYSPDCVARCLRG